VVVAKRVMVEPSTGSGSQGDFDYAQSEIHVYVHLFAHQSASFGPVQYFLALKGEWAAGSCAPLRGDYGS
jgi:hypothetical protein